MKTVFLLFGFLCLFSPIIAQEMGFSFIRNYTPKEYGGSGQVWTVVQDQRGILYFGDEDGILEYDGKTWRKMYSEKKVRFAACP